MAAIKEITTYQFAVGFVLAAVFFQVWIILAVGFIGREGDLADLMYIGVIAVAVIGAFIARFRPHRMARALFATALAQALVAVIALFTGKPQASVTPMGLFLAANAIFVMLWAGSAWLFRDAARELSPAGRGPAADPRSGD
ncbi:MAG: hypothetical protein ACYTHJ_06845 [Planctomycetota bacterium]|jgi:hypothetical protein